MQRLVIDNFGPIKHCDITFSRYMTFTGFQASGKSTIAKTVYFFRGIVPSVLFSSQLYFMAFGMAESMLEGAFESVFGKAAFANPEMEVVYYYTDSLYIKIYNDVRSIGNRRFPYYKLVLSEKLSEAIFDAFDADEIDEAESPIIGDENIVYIPAGRSTLSVLSQQMSYIYGTMKDEQKDSIDKCTRDYIERLMLLRPRFSEGLIGLLSECKNKALYPKLELALDLIEKILRGSYVVSGNGDERISVDDSTSVPLNLASSGQQEAVWITNLLFYYLVQEKPTMFIIEEPESHLFPDSQKYISELIALVVNCGHSAIVTTHSPYVLGTLNNLLYASQMPDEKKEEVEKVIPSDLWLKNSDFDAYFVKNGGAECCMDEEMEQIQSEKIDEISNVINGDFEALLNLRYEDEENENGAF